MKILHTTDWHIGQLFHEYDRTWEHQRFLIWLLDTLTKAQVGVLLISGDVFDLSNPSAASIKVFYFFLNQAVKANPGLQIIITAGNHDSASRLESPKPLLESSNIHIIGLVEKDGNGVIDYSKITIQSKDKDGDTKVWCIAAPFLKMGDHPVIADCDNHYTERIAAFYKEAYEHVVSKKRSWSGRNHHGAFTCPTSKQYLLQRTPNSLGLQVLDLDMDDEVRTVYSLSGGESFLASLALALGLASLSSSRMKVGSLFIDEGFGSLDPTTLNVAMDALERLHNQGRKVGVISHVQEMTERIPVHIRMRKQQSAKSVVEII